MNSAELPTPSLWLRFWHLPTITVARFILRSYVRSGWVFASILFIWFLYALFFADYGGNVAYFYSTVGPGLSVLAVLDAIVLVQRSLRSARAYVPLARLSSRSAYMRGLLLAIGVLRVPYFLLMLLLAMSYHAHSPQFGIIGATFFTMLPGAIGLLVNCVVLATLTTVLLVPIATRRLQIVFLAWLAALLYSDTGHNIVTSYLSIAQVPLTPLTVCYNFGLTDTVDAYGLVMLLLGVGYIVALTCLADVLLARRDLILQ